MQLHLENIVEILGSKNEEPHAKEKLSDALRDNRIRTILDIDRPPVENWSDTLDIGKGGKVFAIRYDKLKNVPNHKKLVVACLILYGIIKGKIPSKGVDTLIDAGGLNTPIALKYYTEKFGLKAYFIISRLLPRDIISDLESVDFTLETAPENTSFPVQREREFYAYLLQRMLDKGFSRNKHCIWHAKYGGAASSELGAELGRAFQEEHGQPDCLVSAVGAGTTLEGVLIPFADQFENKPTIVVSELDTSPLFSRIKPSEACHNEDIDSETSGLMVRQDILIPGAIIGPHHDEINPFLGKESLGRVNGVVQYSSASSLSMLAHLQKKGIHIGTSSAANICVARYLANQGKVVCVPIYEKTRKTIQEA